MNERIDKLTKEFSSEIADLKLSMGFTEDVLERKISSCEQKLSHIEKFKLTSFDEWNDTKGKINDLENLSRRNNIRVDGVPESPKETWEQSEEKVKKILKEKLKIEEDISIETAHRTQESRTMHRVKIDNERS